MQTLFLQNESFSDFIKACNNCMPGKNLVLKLQSLKILKETDYLNLWQKRTSNLFRFLFPKCPDIFQQPMGTKNFKSQGYFIGLFRFFAGCEATIKGGQWEVIVKYKNLCPTFTFHSYFTEGKLFRFDWKQKKDFRFSIQVFWTVISFHAGSVAFFCLYKCLLKANLVSLISSNLVIVILKKFQAKKSWTIFW